ncbi:myosin light chain kinase, smooth muscle-like, partial [Varroa destructor]|uniref:Ig-like domain-containing protein n=1 Tax=Varroa destructor TaxID=109461 RepID=A0A7M7L592_VARDE
MRSVRSSLGGISFTSSPPPPIPNCFDLKSRKRPGDRQPLPVTPHTATTASNFPHGLQGLGGPGPQENQGLPSKIAKMTPSPAAPPSFIEEPTPRQISPNEVIFQGRVQGDPLPEVRWAVDNRTLVSGGDVQTSVSSDGVFYLRLINIQPHDAGRYTCTASNEHGQVTTTNVLYVKDRGQRPIFIEPLKPVETTDGSPVLLQCRVIGNPSPSISWFQNRREIRSSEEFRISFNPTTGICQLVIAEVYPDDQGVYACRASNPFGEDETTAPLTVTDVELLESCSDLNVQPRFVLPLQPRTVSEGEPIEMKVEVVAVPAPAIQWFFHGRPIISARDHMITGHKGCKSKLTIPEVFPEDAGPYEVLALNPAGRATSAANLSVTEHTAMDEQTATASHKPTFVLHLQPITVTEGQRAVLRAQVSAVPAAQISWYHNYRLIKPSRDFQVISERNRSTLIVNEVFPDDEGEFTCTAVNSFGMAQSKATLVVEKIVSPDDELESPRILSPLQPLSVMDGSEAKFSVVISGHPQPKVTWFHNDIEVKANDDIWMTQRSDGYCELFISEVFPEDMGEYVCKVSNKAGTVYTRTTLTVESYEYVPDSEVATFSQSLDTTMESIHTASLSFSEELDTDADFSIEIPDLPMDEPLSTSELAKLSTKQKPPTGKPPRHGPESLHDSQQPRRSGRRGDRPNRRPDSRTRTPTRGEHEHRPRSSRKDKDKKPLCGHRRGTPDSSRPSIWSPTRKPSDASEHSVSASLSASTPAAHSWSPRRSSTPGTAAKFDVPLEDVIVPLGQPATLDAKVSGHPRPKVTWYKNGEVIRWTPDCQISYETSGISTLTVQRTQLDDFGFYACECKNAYGVDMTECELVQLDMKSMCPIRKVPSHDHKLKLDFKPQKPKFERELYPEYVKPLGTPVTLEVIARGRPKPTFTWYFNSTKIRIGSSTKYIVTVLNDRCMLQILELSKDTEGLYTCRAVNEHGESTTTTRITIGEYEEMVTPSPIDSIGQRPQEDVVSSIRSDEYVEHYTPALGEQLQRPTEITADDFVMLHYTVGTTQTTDTATTVTQRTATSREDITGMNQRGPQLPQAAKPGSPIPSRVQYMPGPISGFAQEEIPQLQPQPTTKTMIEQAREYLIKMIPKPVWQFSMWSADQSNVCQPGEAIEKPAHPAPAWPREAIQPRLPGEEIPQAPQYPTVRDADQRSQALFPGQELPSYLQTAALRQPQ